MTNPSTEPMRILVIAAHPDDIEFGSAGSIARWAEEGAQITYCLVTDGSAGSNDPDIKQADLIARRREEQIAAAKVVGVHDVRFLGYRDGYLQPTLELRRDLTRLIREIRPYRVLCQDPTTVFFPNYINHPDHRAAGEAAVYAVFPSAETRPVFPELLAEGFEPFHVTEVYLMFSQQPNCFIGIDNQIERKIASLLCHRSQVDEAAGEWLRKQDAELGQIHGHGFAESYRVMRFPREETSA